MGSLILKNAKINENGYDESYGILKIVDGQQKLTSLLIILKALYDTLINKNIEPSDFLNDLFKVIEN